jgi:DNA-binding XRE family transcriptional regulator
LLLIIAAISTGLCAYLWVSKNHLQAANDKPQNPDLIRFGKHLKALRNDQKLSRKQVASLCNITEQKVKEYEVGTVDVTLLFMVRLAVVLQVELWKLIDYKDILKYYRPIA